jgi:2-polyprenyl-6-methoxyphenol hydroxylase-like FAD-dependent oxidoreductase
LLRGLKMPDDAVFSVNAPSKGEGSFIFPIGKDRFRAYYCFHQDTGYQRLSGSRDVAPFVASCVRAGTPAEWFEAAEPAGPLATFDASDHWVAHPYARGIVLVGDAAATPDPSWGCRLSLVLRGVRLLRDGLVATEDWESAGHAYADQFYQLYDRVHRLETWMSDMFYEIGPEAEARRARAYPLLAEEPDRWPDLVVKGPESPSDETARRRFFAED